MQKRKKERKKISNDFQARINLDAILRARLNYRVVKMQVFDWVECLLLIS